MVYLVVVFYYVVQVVGVLVDQIVVGFVEQQFGYCQVGGVWVECIGQGVGVVYRVVVYFGYCFCVLVIGVGWDCLWEVLVELCGVGSVEIVQGSQCVVFDLFVVVDDVDY